MISFMQLSGPLSYCKSNKLSKLTTSMSIILVLCLCCCMLWQCSTCLLKYLASPTGSNLDFSLEPSQSSPVTLTICYFLWDNYSFPELKALEARIGSANNDWKTIWNTTAASVAVETLLTLAPNDGLRLCKMFHTEELSSLAELRLLYFSSSKYNRSQIDVYLHNSGIFLAPYFVLTLPRMMLQDNPENYILELNLETIIGLPSSENDCSLDESGPSYDSCLKAEATRRLNASRKVYYCLLLKVVCFGARK